MVRLMVEKIDVATVLLIEDNINLRNNISSRLRSSFYKVQSPINGFHAINLFEEDEYDLVLILSDMSDMSLIEVLSLIRTNTHKDSLPIICYSESREEIADAFNLGANDFLIDKNDFQEINNKLERSKKVRNKYLKNAS